MTDCRFSLLIWVVFTIIMHLVFYQVSSVYHPYLVTTQLIGSNALRRKEITQINRAHLLIEMHCRWPPHEAESVPRVCKAVIKQRVATLKNLKYKIRFDLFNTFLLFTWFHMCYFIVLMSPLLFYNVENSFFKNEEKAWSE